MGFFFFSEFTQRALKPAKRISQMALSCRLQNGNAFRLSTPLRVSSGSNRLSNLDGFFFVDLSVKQKKRKRREYWQESQKIQRKIQNGCNQEIRFPFLSA